LSKIDQFTLNQDQNDHRPITTPVVKCI